MLRRLILGVFVLVLAVGAFGYAALVLPAFEGWRQQQVQEVLSEFLEREVTIAGKVDVFPGTNTRVVLTDISIKDASWTTEDNAQKIGRTEFSVPTIPLLLGDDVGLTGLVFETVRINLDIDEKGQSNYEKSSADGDLKEPLTTLTAFLGSDVARGQFVLPDRAGHSDAAA